MSKNRPSQKIYEVNEGEDVRNNLQEIEKCVQSYTARKYMDAKPLT